MVVVYIASIEHRNRTAMLTMSVTTIVDEYRFDRTPYFAMYFANFAMYFVTYATVFEGRDTRPTYVYRNTHYRKNVRCAIGTSSGGLRDVRTSRDSEYRTTYVYRSSVPIINNNERDLLVRKIRTHDDHGRGDVDDFGTGARCR